jgi:hypothetical protein
MATVKLPYDKVVASTTGHVIRFLKDEPTVVPDAMVRELLEIGGVNVDAENDADDSDESGSEGLATLIRDAVDAILQEGDKDNLTKDGKVTIKAVREKLAPTPVSAAAFKEATK